MKTLEPLIRRVFFYGAFVLLVVAAVEKVANILGTSLLKAYKPRDLLEWVVIALIFAIAMELRQIRLLLGSKSGEPSK
jgi:hypothetical protein